MATLTRPYDALEMDGNSMLICFTKSRIMLVVHKYRSVSLVPLISHPQKFVKSKKAVMSVDNGDFVANVKEHGKIVALVSIEETIVDQVLISKDSTLIKRVQDPHTRKITSRAISLTRHSSSD